MITHRNTNNNHNINNNNNNNNNNNSNNTNNNDNNSTCHLPGVTLTEAPPANHSNVALNNTSDNSDSVIESISPLSYSSPLSSPRINRQRALYLIPIQLPLFRVQHQPQQQPG